LSVLRGCIWNGCQLLQKAFISEVIPSTFIVSTLPPQQQLDVKETKLGRGKLVVSQHLLLYIYY